MGSLAGRLSMLRPSGGAFPLPGALKAAYRRRLVEEFHRYYYMSGPWQRTTWLGVQAKQCPMDIVVLQEIVWETRPDLVLELGTMFGGTARLFASVFDALGHGEVLCVDIDVSPAQPEVREHPRVALIEGDTRSADIREEVYRRAEGKRVMLYHDADHTRAGVLGDLRAYADLVTPGCYAVVADSNLNGHPLKWQSWLWDPGTHGPFEAVQDFLGERDDFEIDRSREHHLLTFNPSGYLRRVQ